MEIIEKLKRSNNPLISKVLVDEFTDIANNCFDYEFNGITKVYPFLKPNNIPKDFNIGIIVGASGSGKSTLLNEFGVEESIQWDNNKAIISNFNSPNEAIDKLTAVGLNSIPSWVRPYEVLSTGEKFRADLSRRLKDNAVIDEFTSVVDRNVAKSCCVSISKYIKNNNLKNIIFSSCHKDILEWLEPNWVIDTDMGILYDGRCLRRPKLELSIYETDYKTWEMFKQHHYLTANINKASKCYIMKWNNNIVGFCSVRTSPNGYVKNSWCIHRLVILPDFQGMGLGKIFINYISNLYIKKGCRMFIKTASIKLGKYMDKSNKWIATTHNKQRRHENEKMLVKKWHGYNLDTKRKCYTYEYVGCDYFNKDHIRIGIKFNGKLKSQEEFNNYINNYLEKYKNKYIIFVSTEVGKDNFADSYAMKNNIRREFLGKKKNYDILLEL